VYLSGTLYSFKWLLTNSELQVIKESTNLDW
jgi:hypothetical protein